MDVNCFELRGPIDANLTRKEHLRGIYPEAAFMSHDCIGNTHVSVDDYYEMSVHASQTIKAGELILFNYCNPLEVIFNSMSQVVF